MQRVKKILHEPLIHFLIFGMIVYGYYLLQEPSNTNSIKKEKIILSKSTMTNKDQNITSKELLDLYIKKDFYDTVLLNEACTLGLEKEDKQIRKKLLEKMHFILLQNNFQEPTEEELLKYYKSHIEDYTQKKELSFTVIEFPSLEAAEEIAPYIDLIDIDLSQLKHYKNLEYETIVQTFGRYVANKIFTLPKGVWSAPLKTSNTTLLVQVTNYNRLLQPLPFDEVEFRVYEDLKHQQLLALKIKRLKKIFTRYELILNDD